MKHARGAAGGDLILFIFFLIVLGIVWALTGGPDRSISRQGPFLNPPFPLGDGSAYSVPGVAIPEINSGGDFDYSNGSPETRDNTTLADLISRIRGGSRSSEANSPYADLVELSTGQIRSTDPSSEYVVLKTNRDVAGRLTISDWRIESTVSLTGVTLGSASYLPFSGQINSESPVAVGPNTTIYIVTGRSPIGASFRSNRCTGYFEQFQDFSPSLQEECPFPEDELHSAVSRGDFVPNDSCIDFVDSIRRCQLTVSNIPTSVGNLCQSFILADLTYNGCVNLHKAEATFYKDEWRIYLDRDQELWKEKNDRIRLLDENGLVIDVLSY